MPVEDIFPRWYAKLCSQIKKTTGQSNRFPPFIASTSFQVTKPKPKSSLSNHQTAFFFLVSFRVHLKPSFMLGYCPLEQMNLKDMSTTPLGFWQRVCLFILTYMLLIQQCFQYRGKSTSAFVSRMVTPIC